MMFPDSTQRPPRVHFCGIGGTAMVAGARLAVEAGWEVRGSDQPLYPPTSDMVAALGVPVAVGYAAENLDWDPDVVVLGNVLSRGHPEVEAVLDRRMRYVSLPEWLKDVVLRPRRPVVIAGTHGKTTTTALAAYALERAGMSPGYLIGGQPLDFAHSAHLGPEGAPFVIEGDEYDTAFFDKRAKFLHYVPEIAVVTSIEFDHGDIYKDLAEIERAFQLMLRQIPKNGWLLFCADDPGAAALAKHAFCQVASYGLAPNADWRGQVSRVDGRDVLAVSHFDQKYAAFVPPLAGRHNILNTIAAVAVAGIVGADPAAIESAMPRFQGVKRRLEVFLEAWGMTFVDDFAHHPTAIRETLAAARNRWSGRRVWALFEPRSNTVVTNRFQRELTDALALADRVGIGPIYRVEKIPTETRLDRDAVINELRTRGVEARYADRVEDLVDDVTEYGRDGDVILIMSNGAFGGIYEQLREAMKD